MSAYTPRADRSASAGFAGTPMTSPVVCSDFLDRMADAGLQRLFVLWAREWSVRGVPRRSALPPDRLGPALLPWIAIHERRQGRYFCRLAGTSLRDMLGMDPTGRFLDEMLPPDAARLRAAQFDDCLAGGHPLLVQETLSIPGRARRPFVRLLLPVMAQARDQPDQILCCTSFPAEGAPGLTPAGGPGPRATALAASPADLRRAAGIAMPA